jgi:biopolymer transport protein ExbD
MRRFSQRNPLVTLSDINITPLLDLAFVLLIIFVIISPGIKSTEEHGLDLTLPSGGQPDRPLERSDIRNVEVSPRGQYKFEGRDMSAAAIQRELIRSVRANPKLVVYLRADGDGPLKFATEIIDVCAEHRITCSIRTKPKTQR